MFVTVVLFHWAGLKVNTKELFILATLYLGYKVCVFLLVYLVLLSIFTGRRQWQPTPVLLPGKSHGRRAWWAAVHGVARSRTRLSDFTFTFHFHALEKEMATHSSVLAWRILGTREPGGLPSMGSHKVGHDWSDLAAAAAAVFSLMHALVHSFIKYVLNT